VAGRQAALLQRRRRQIADIAVAMTLDPDPALGFVENGDGLSEQKLGVETGGGQRLPAKWRQRPRNLPRAAGSVARGLDDALQLLGRKIRAPGVTADREGSAASSMAEMAVAWRSSSSSGWRSRLRNGDGARLRRRRERYASPLSAQVPGAWRQPTCRWGVAPHGDKRRRNSAAVIAPPNGLS
jgi:hypothetical protein